MGNRNEKETNLSYRFFFFILFEFHPVAFITYSKKKKKQIRYFENVSVRKFITP